MPKYSMLISWSEEDQAYIVSVPELPGCMADGKTPEEAVKEAQNVIELWIETALEDGETITEPALFTSVTVQMEVVKITVSKAAQRATEKYAKENYDRILVKFPKGTKEQIQATGETVNGFINKAVAERLEKQAEK